MVKTPESFESSAESDDDGSERISRTAPGIGAFARSTLEQSRRQHHEHEESEKKKSERKAEKAEKKKDSKSELFSEEPKLEKTKENKDTAHEKSTAETESGESEATDVEIESEKHDVLREQLQAEALELQSTLETAEPGSVEYAEAAALLAVNEQLSEKLENPDIKADPAIDAEFDQRIAEISAEAGEDTDTEAEPDNPVVPIASAPFVAPTTGVPTPVIAGNGGTTPPRPPVPPTPTSPPPPPRPPIVPQNVPFGGGGNPDNGVNFNVQPPQNNPNVLQPAQNEIVHVKDPSDLLLGGVIGYMVGRRGGRKRTERRLQPEVNRLKTEVEQTKRHLATREDELKKVVSEQIQPQIREQVVPKREVVPAQQRQIPIAEILRQTVTTPEQVETTSPVKAEVKPAQTLEIQIKKVENMNTPELLKLAESTIIEGVSVRRLYETNQIDRKGLVKIVQEGIRGKDVKKVYEQVELGRERQNERAREFRHDDPSFTAVSSDDIVLPNHQPVTAHNTPDAMPNNPDPTSVQPISSQSVTTPAQPELSTQSSESAKPESKQSYFPAIAIFAIGLGLLLVWFLFSL